MYDVQTEIIYTVLFVELLHCNALSTVCLFFLLLVVASATCVPDCPADVLVLLLPVRLLFILHKNK